MPSHLFQNVNNIFKMINEIKIPQILIEQKTFCLKIDENNTKLFAYIEYLSNLVQSMNKIYRKLCGKIIQTAEEYQRKIINDKYTNNHVIIILNFIKNLNFLHLTINNQLNFNKVTLKTKTQSLAIKRLATLKDKLYKCNQLNRQYLEEVDVFNRKERSFRQKCEYFNDYQKDVLKYYSLKANTRLYQKLSEKEMRLKERLELIIPKKDLYKINIEEIKNTVVEFYNDELYAVSEYKLLLLNIRKGSKNNVNQIYNQPIIEERSEDANSTYWDGPTLKTSDRGKDRTIVQMRKEIIKEFERCSEVQEFFEDFIKTFQQEIETTGRRIDEVRDQKQYEHFVSQRLIMSEILPTETLKQIDLIINEISLFRTIVLRFTNVVIGALKFLGELKKYRGFNFDKFVDDTNHYAEIERKNGISIDLSLEYKEIQQKFYSNHNEHNLRYQAKVVELQNTIYQQYYLEDSVIQENKMKRNIKNNLFQKKYYEILRIPFFLNKNESFNFVENAHLQKFSNHLNANKIQKMMTLTGFYGKEKKVRIKSTCCGLLRKEDEQEGPKMIDEYHCALKDGLILIQGKLKIFENYLNFTSNFNSKTIFGYSDIRIPKWDINNFSKDRHILSLMINVQTNHGVLSFTSFITNPFERLQQIYSNRKSGMSIAEHKNTGESQLHILQERFQSELRGELKRKNIIIDKLSTYLSEDNQSLSICIEYHLNGTQETILFEIKMNYSEITLEYMFIHDEIQKNQEIRNILENVSKALINRTPQTQRKDKNEKPENNNLSLDFEYSIIEQNEKNKISFLKEPSFINKKSENYSDDVLRNSQTQFGQLLTSRNFLQQTSKNIEMLEQKILLSDGNESKSLDGKQTPISKVSAFNASNSILEHTFSPKIEKDKSETDILQERSRTKSTTIHSKKSSHSSRKAGQSFNYGVIFIFLGILLGLNLILNSFN